MQYHRNPEESVLREKREVEGREVHCYRDTDGGKGENRALRLTAWGLPFQPHPQCVCICYGIGSLCCAPLWLP